MKHIIQDKKKVGTFEIVLDPQAGKHSAAGGLSESEAQGSVRSYSNQASGDEALLP